jgi:CHAT domain-containing protein/tetratricopeptide (TPR) repeat protein
MIKPQKLGSKFWIIALVPLVTLFVLFFFSCQSLPSHPNTKALTHFFDLDKLILQDEFGKANDFLDSLEVLENDRVNKDLQLLEAYLSLKKENDYPGFEATFNEDTTLLAQIVKAEYYLISGDFNYSESLIDELIQKYLNSINSSDHLDLKLLDLKANLLIQSRKEGDELTLFTDQLNFDFTTRDDYAKILVIKRILLKAITFERTAKYQEAMTTYHLALNHLRGNGLNQFFSSLVAEIYSLLATIHYKEKNFDVALNYYHKAKKIYESLEFKDLELSKLYANLGDLYGAKGKSEKALGLLNSSIKEFQYFSPFWNAYSRQKLGIYYFDRGKQDSSKFYLNESLNMMKDFDDCLPTKRISYDYLCYAYIAENYDSAYYYLNKTINDSLCWRINKFLRNYIDFLDSKASIEASQCIKLQDTKRCNLAIDYYNIRKEYIANNFAKENELHYSDFMLYHSHSVINLLWQLYKKNPTQENVKNVLKVIHESQSRTLKSSIYQKEFEARSNYLSTADKSRYEKIKEGIDQIMSVINDFKETSFPDSVIYKDLYYLFEQRAQLFVKTESSINVVVEEFKQFEALRESCIKNKTQIFQYHMTPFSNWLVYINPDTIILDSVDIDTVLPYLDFVNINILNRSDTITDSLLVSLQELYNLMIKPYISNSYENIVIIPDGRLQNCPFEALLQKPDTSFKDASFLVQNYNISYGFDLNNLAINTSHEYPVNSSLIFSYTDQKTMDKEEPTDFEEIEATYKACQRIDSILNNQERNFYSGENALVENFLDKLDSDIIHIGLHGESNTENRFDHFLGFRDDQLEKGKFYTYKLQNRETKAKLVVLAACETGVGKYTPGAGTYSISQDFLSIGAESVVKTLWKVLDKETGAIMVDFYKEMMENNLTIALVLAKRNFLNKSDEKHSHPYYWSGFVLEGNPYLRFKF